ncbi:MAG: hypothetical protein JSR15_08605 [Proteobacteria bacterium]|nr:hypothetical protein [Pseudomonadota bacterium]
MRRKARASQKALRNRRLELEVDDLLVPIVEFLQRSGFTPSDLQSEWRAAIRKCAHARKGVKVVRIGFDKLGLTLVSRWLRDPAFLNHVGRPDDLPIRGKRSIESLLKACAISLPVTAVVNSLARFGTVRRISPNRYRLVRRSVNFEVPHFIPFEPSFEFLIDAVRASTWGSGIEQKKPRLFWQNVASSRVPRRHAAEFLRFAKDRGLTFMHEINDWLEAHEGDSGTDAKKGGPSGEAHRLGIGLFGICSNR